MSALLQLALTDVKLYLREPSSAFFTIAFAPMLLVLFGSIYGNEPRVEFGGRGSMDISVPAYMGVVIATVGLISIPIGSAVDRERGILRRYRATPLRPLTYIGADVLTYFLMTTLGALLLVAVGAALFKVRFEGDPAALVAGFALSALSFFAMGYVIGAVAPTARAAQTAGMLLAYPMMFLSGSTIPLEVLPENVRQVAAAIPLTHVVLLLRGLWAGDAFAAHATDALFLAALLVVGTVVSARLFRWKA